MFFFFGGGEYLFQIICLFLIDIFFLLLSYRSSSYILERNPLSDIWFAKIFSHSIGHLSILLMVLLQPQSPMALPFTSLWPLDLLPSSSTGQVHLHMKAFALPLPSPRTFFLAGPFSHLLGVWDQRSFLHDASPPHHLHSTPYSPYSPPQFTFLHSLYNNT